MALLSTNHKCTHLCLLLLRREKLLWRILKMLLSYRRTQPPVDCLWSLKPSFPVLHILLITLYSELRFRWSCTLWKACEILYKFLLKSISFEQILSIVVTGDTHRFNRCHTEISFSVFWPQLFTRNSDFDGLVLFGKLVKLSTSFCWSPSHLNKFWASVQPMLVVRSGAGS